MTAKENAYIRVANAAYRVALRHTRLELIEHQEWRELEKGLSELIQINRKEKENGTTARTSNRVGFHPREED